MCPAVARSLSTIADGTAMVTFVDFQGTHHTVPGRVGQRLTDVASLHGLEHILHCDASGGGLPMEKIHSDNWTEDLFGEGAVSPLSHVVIPPNFFSLLKAPTEKELSMLSQVEERAETSRLGSEIVLTKELDGIKVFCPDSPPYDIP
jgi:ferredoxin